MKNYIVVLAAGMLFIKCVSMENNSFSQKCKDVEKNNKMFINCAKTILENFQKSSTTREETFSKICKYCNDLKNGQKDNRKTNSMLISLQLYMSPISSIIQNPTFPRATLVDNSKNMFEEAQIKSIGDMLNEENKEIDEWWGNSDVPSDIDCHNNDEIDLKNFDEKQFLYKIFIFKIMQSKIATLERDKEEDDKMKSKIAILERDKEEENKNILSTIQTSYRIYFASFFDAKRLFKLYPNQYAKQRDTSKIHDYTQPVDLRLIAMK